MFTVETIQGTPGTALFQRKFISLSFALMGSSQTMVFWVVTL
jgi:hypothetical protein